MTPDRFRTAILAATAVVAVLAAAGCSAPSSTTRAVEAAAQSFRTAVASGDAEAVCALLTGRTASELEQGGTPCPAAVDELDLSDPGPLDGVEIWGRSALARFGGEAAFLTRVDDAWRVSAAACELQTDRPAGCEVGG